MDSSVFTEGQYFTINLYVPKGSKDTFMKTEGWKNFLNIIEEGGEDLKEDCSPPTISFSNGILSFGCQTEGAEYVTTITDSDVKQHFGPMIQLSATYNISVYAVKSGYNNSEIVTATLCWIEQQPATEGLTDGVTNVPAKAVLIKNDGGFLTIEGAEEGERINVYSIDGTFVGSAICNNGSALVNTNQQLGNVAIVNIGKKSVKVILK